MRRDILLLLLSLTVPGLAQAYTEAGETVTLRGSLDDDLYAAGGTVDIDADIDGDVIAAGGEIAIGHRISGDVIAAGGTLRIHGEVRDDVRISGGELDVDARIGDDLAASGGSIVLSGESRIGGDAWLAGGEVRMAGTVDGKLTVIGGEIHLSGTVLGDVELEGGQINLLEGAKIGGDLRYQSPRPASTHASASVSGQVTHEAIDPDYADHGFGLFFSLTLVVAGILFYLLFPGYTVASAKRVVAKPWSSLGAGFVFLVATPFVAFALMLIVLGFWVGLIVLALYCVALVLGFLIGCIFIGDRGAALFKQELSTPGRRLISLTVAIFVLGLVQTIPLLGGLALFLLLLFGLGAGLLQLHNAYRLPAGSS